MTPPCLRETGRGEFMRKIESAGDLEMMLDADRAILFKHSTNCGFSAAAWRQVAKFVEKFPAAEVFVITVSEPRRLSQTRLPIQNSVVV